MSTARTKYLSLILGALVLVWCADAAIGQQPGRFGRGQERGPGRGPGGPGGARGPGFPGLGPFDLLQREDVRKELELLDDQLKDLGALQERMQNRMRELAAGMRERGGQGQDRGEGLRGGFRSAFETLNKEIQAELAKILLPHQSKRLQQLSLQRRMQGGGMAMLGGDVSQQLSITDAQRGELRDKAQEIEAELRRKIAELRRQSQDQILALLTPEQQAKFRDLVGVPFEFQDPPRPAGPDRRAGGAGRGPRDPGRRPEDANRRPRDSGRPPGTN